LRTISLTSPTFAQPVFADQYLFVTDGNAATLTAYAVPSGGTGDFAVSQTASADPVTVDSQVTYTATVSNTGTGGPVTLTDTPPSGVQVGSVTPSQGSCSGTAPIVCDLGSVSTSATVDVSMTPILPGTIANT